jgi:hypothetical protein
VAVRICPHCKAEITAANAAAYLDVAVRHGAPRATLDATLQKAVRVAGIKIFKV